MVVGADVRMVGEQAGEVLFDALGRLTGSRKECVVVLVVVVRVE